MGKSSKKSKKHQRKRSSGESSDSSEGSPKRVAHREPEERHRRKREASDDGKGVSSKWDSPEENSLSYRRHRERNFDAHREDQSSGRRDNRQQRERYVQEDRRDRSGRRQRHSPSPKGDFRDNRRRFDDRHLEEQPRKHRDEGQDRGRRHRESREGERQREERYDERREDRSEQNERFHDRDKRYEEGRRRRDHRSRSPNRKFPRHDEDDRKYDWGKRDDKSFGEQTEPAEKEKPNFGLSGKLTEDTNKVNGVVIKYAEPQEARKPKRRWRLYPFKGEQALPTMYIHRQSCFLIGRDAKVCDLRVDHPSCSKQHAALQYRLVPFEREDGSVGKRVRPYIIDLESSNGTFVNNNKVDARKYVELLEKDVIKFGFSSREYVLLHENSHEETLDDDVNLEQEIKTEPAE